MDFSGYIPNIADLLRTLGASSYNKLNLQVRGLLPCSVKRAKAIEIATGGRVKAVWILGLESPPAQHDATSGTDAA